MRGVAALVGADRFRRGLRRPTRAGVIEPGDRRRCDIALGRALASTAATPAAAVLAAAMFFVYALALVGHGLPFWPGTALFVGAYVFVFQYPARKAEGRVVRGAVVAIACGALTAAIVTLVFEQLFYVRLP